MVIYHLLICSLPVLWAVGGAAATCWVAYLTKPFSPYLGKAATITTLLGCWWLDFSFVMPICSALPGDIACSFVTLVPSKTLGIFCAAISLLLISLARAFRSFQKERQTWGMVMTVFSGGAVVLVFLYINALGYFSVLSSTTLQL